MRIRLLAFASASDALGTNDLELSLPDGSRLADVKRLLERDHPKLGRLWPRLALAVDGELASDETLLEEGAEVALLPPVSGGAGEAPVDLVDEPIDPAAWVARVAAPEHGAVVLFLGTARDQHEGRRVERLTYTAYRPMARRALERIVAELESQVPELRLAIVHRLGPVEVGQASVAIAAASPHRQAAYEASRTALERLKHEVPIWKREHYADGEAAWREEEPLTEAVRQ